MNHVFCLQAALVSVNMLCDETNVIVLSVVLKVLIVLLAWFGILVSLLLVAQRDVLAIGMQFVSTITAADAMQDFSKTQEK